MYSEDRYDNKSGLLSFKLSYGISGRSASDIGRLRLDPVALRAAAMVSVSMLKAKSTGEPAFVQSFFPFEGNTFLDVSGKWLSFQGESNQTFLVYGINSCTHSFPFKALKYVTADTRVKPQYTQHQQPNDKSEITGSSRDKKDQPLIEKDPSSTLQGKTKQVHQRERFPDLRGKPVWKERVLSLKEFITNNDRSQRLRRACAMTVDDGTTRYGMAIMETTPDFTRMYPLGDKAVPVEEILAQVELEFLSLKEETH